MIVTYFGSPGCGKSTLAIKLAKKNMRYYSHCSLNFDHLIEGAYVCNLDRLGEWTFPDCSFVCIDEAGIEYNSRAYKSLPKPAIAWFKKHRHYRTDIAIFSQSWEDMDITLRRLSDQLWYLKKIGPFTLSRRIFKRVTVDKQTEQIIDGYRMASILWLLVWPLQLDVPFAPFAPRFKLTFRPFYYKYFNSYSKDDITVKVHKCVTDKPKRKEFREWLTSMTLTAKRLMRIMVNIPVVRGTIDKLKRNKK